MGKHQQIKVGTIVFMDTHIRHLTYTQGDATKTEGTYKNFFIILSEVF